MAYRLDCILAVIFFIIRHIKIMCKKIIRVIIIKYTIDFAKQDM